MSHSHKCQYDSVLSMSDQRRGQFCPKQQEINRLRRVMHDIAGSRPDEHMDIEKHPELVNWISDTCRKASVGAYPSNDRSQRRSESSLTPNQTHDATGSLRSLD